MMQYIPGEDESLDCLSTTLLSCKSRGICPLVECFLSLSDGSFGLNCTSLYGSIFAFDFGTGFE